MPDDFYKFIFLFQIFCCSEQFGKAYDGIKRRTDFMTHVGQECRFELIRTFGLQLSLVQFTDHILPLGDVVESQYHSFDFIFRIPDRSCKNFNRFTCMFKDLSFGMPAGKCTRHDTMFTRLLQAKRFKTLTLFA